MLCLCWRRIPAGIFRGISDPACPLPFVSVRTVLLTVWKGKGGGSPTSLAFTYASYLPCLLCFRTQTRELPGHQERSSVRKPSLIGQSWCSGSIAQAFRTGGGVQEMRNVPLYRYSIMMNWLCFSKTRPRLLVHPYYLLWSPKAHYHINSLCYTVWPAKWAYLLPS